MLHDESFQDGKKIFTRRSFLLGAGQVALGGILLGRLIYLGAIRAPHYRTLADGNRIKVQLLLPERGMLLDRCGEKLAFNDTSYRLVMTPDLAGNIPKTLDALESLGIFLDDFRMDILNAIQKKPRYMAHVLREDLSWDEVCRIEVHLPELKGIDVLPGYSRTYPLGPTCAHLIGYVGVASDDDSGHLDSNLLKIPDFRTGKLGIEKNLNDLLVGVPGFKEVEVNAIRRVVRELSLKPAQKGTDVRVSIHGKLQTAVAGILKDTKSASSVVMNCRTGEILSLVSHPSFDPNLFVGGIRSNHWRSLSENPYGILSNKAIQGAYGPGSLYKMVVALAAFESGAVPVHYESFCPGYRDVGTHRFHCWHKHGGHGRLGIVRALCESCDCYFFDIAQKTGIDAIARMADIFGLGHKTGIALPGELKGFVSKRRDGGRPWTIGQTILSSIGQGDNLATPLQLAVMMARLATGVAVSPTLLTDDNPRSFFTPLPIQDKHLILIRDGLNQVINNPAGTGTGAAMPDASFLMAGKTATTQVRRITMAERARGVVTNEDLPWHRRDHALFGGFAPYDDPRFVVSVVIEHGGSGGRYAAPMARDIMTAVRELGVT